VFGDGDRRHSPSPENASIDRREFRFQSLAPPELLLGIVTDRRIRVRLVLRTIQLREQFAEVLRELVRQISPRRIRSAGLDPKL